jgi:tRNA G18 (ribose-2'-O)-methylase SpoU
MGEVLHLPYARATPWPQVISMVRRAGFAVVALTPSADATPIDDLAPLLGDRRVAVVLGAEGPGLTAGVMAAADHRVRIPIGSGADSINVGHAAAIAFHVFGRR